MRGRIATMNERELFIAARHKTDAVAQGAFLDEACSGDAELRQRVAALLREYDQLGSFLEDPAAVFHSDATERAGAERASGILAGRYKLLEEIGEGGMGAVWMAQQTEPVKRRVAVKLIKAGMDSKQVLARFEAERQALALMDHPNIAKVLDAGQAPDGRPFFVMELVKGVPITRYCDERRLNPRQRLELFVPVCQAIQHAHTKGIIHRDIKPSNVLVALYDDQAVIKIIDFGVAKAIDQPLTDRTLFTGFGAVIGTLEYMSPEQAELNNRDIDTRSDIYSLGVLLYELLTGTTPLDRKRHKGTGFLDLLRLVREGEATRPSTRLCESKDTLPTISAQRHTEPGRLTKVLRGELDWIIMKALEKDRNRRYETSNGLAQDVRRYLDNDPVQACPPSHAYRLRRIISRNRKAAIAAGLILLTLVIGIIATSISLVWAMHERDAAEQARGEAEANLLLARQVVDEMYTQAAADVAQLPRMQPFQRELLQKALRFYQQLAGRKTKNASIRLETAHALQRVGTIQVNFRQLTEAEAAFRQSLQLLEELTAELPSDPRRRKLAGLVHWNLGNLFQGRRLYPEAEQAYREGLKQLSELANAYPQDLECRQLLAAAHRELGKVLRDAPAAAVAAHEQSIRLGEKILSADPGQHKLWGELAANHIAFGRSHVVTGQLARAEAQFRQGLRTYEHAREELDRSGYRGFLTLAKADLAQVLAATGREDAAEQLWRETLALEEGHAAQFPDVPNHRQQLAMYQIDFAPLLVRRGKGDEAARLLHASAKLCEQLIDEVPADASDNELYKLGFVARNLAEAGDVQAAESIARKVLTLAQKRVADSPRDRAAKQILAEGHGTLGAVLQTANKAKEAAVEVRNQLAILGALIEEFPAIGYYRYYHARAANALGSALRGQADAMDNALQMHQQAIQTCTQLVAEVPEQLRYRHELVSGYYSLASALESGRRREAAQAYDNAASACGPLLVDSRSISFPRAGELVLLPALPVDVTKKQNDR